MELHEYKEEKKTKNNYSYYQPDFYRKNDQIRFSSPTPKKIYSKYDIIIIYLLLFVCLSTFVIIMQRIFLKDFFFSYPTHTHTVIFALGKRDFFKRVFPRKTRTLIFWCIIDPARNDEIWKQKHKMKLKKKQYREIFVCL